MTRLFLLYCKSERLNLNCTFKMICSLELTFVITAIFLLYFEPCLCGCARAEYEIDGECCPMCPPGNHIYRHCTLDTSTTCVPCIESTFIAEPNGLMNCFSCTVCDDGMGLKVKTHCSRTSDTICEPLERHYCTDLDRDSCSNAVEHTKCSPGQYIKRKGTPFNDTVCSSCPEGTYYNGTLQICQLYTKCEDSGLSEIRPGTISSDVECRTNTTPHITIAVVVSFVVLASSGAGAVYYKKNYTNRAECVPQMDNDASIMSFSSK